MVFNQVGSPIRKSPDQRSFAPTRSLSQLTTSFIASQSQGIHRSLFLSFSYAKIVVLRLTRNPSFYLHCELIFFLLVKNLHRLLLNNLILAFTLFQYVKDHLGIYELRFTNYDFPLVSKRLFKALLPMMKTICVVLIKTPFVVLRSLFSVSTTRDYSLTILTLQKGGVPAAPSGTATLLRLSPSY